MIRFREYAKLIRPYGILFLGFTPVFGAICNGETDFTNLFILFIIGILAHIFTFVQNDIFDIEIDKKSSYVSERPLIIGTVSRGEAIFLVIFSLLASVALAGVFLFTNLSFLVLLLSFLLMTLYNKYSKRLFAMEYVLGIGVFTYSLFGALTVSEKVSTLAIIIGLVGMMQWLFSVGVFANMKDVKYDTKMGVKTTPTIFGVKEADDSLQIPIVFKCYAFAIKILHISIASLPFLLQFTSIYVFNLPLPPLFFIFLSIIILYLVAKIFYTPLSRRDNMLIYEGLQEGLSLLLIPIALMGFLFEKIGVTQTMLIIILMILWPLSSLRVVFGKKLIPLE